MEDVAGVCMLMLVCVVGAGSYYAGLNNGLEDKAKTVSPSACECCGGVAFYTESAADGVTAWCRDGQFSG